MEMIKEVIQIKKGMQRLLPIKNIKKKIYLRAIKVLQHKVGNFV